MSAPRCSISCVHYEASPTGEHCCTSLAAIALRQAQGRENLERAKQNTGAGDFERTPKAPHQPVTWGETI